MPRRAERNHKRHEQPRVVVLTSRWRGRDEMSWAVRQVAGAIACSGDVHVVTLEGRRPSHYSDGVFEVHELATFDATAEAKRELVVAALTGSSRPLSAGSREAVSRASRVYNTLTRDLEDPWEPASGLLSKLHPDVVVLAGFRHSGAERLIEHCCPRSSLALIPLTRAVAPLEHALFGTVLERSERIVVFSPQEALALEGICGRDRISFVGLPMSANPSVLREPNAYSGDGDYLFVLSRGDIGEEISETDGHGPGPTEQMLRTYFASMRVAISASDAFVVYDRGMRCHELAPIERRSDLLRLMAWARATVDLCPGPLFGRHSIESLLYGTPIVVPANSAARQHAENGSGGLWFDGISELVWSAEAVVDPANRPVLGRQGRAYAEAGYGSTEQFVDRTLCAIGDVAKCSLERPGQVLEAAVQ